MTWIFLVLFQIWLLGIKYFILKYEQKFIIFNLKLSIKHSKSVYKYIYNGMASHDYLDTLNFFLKCLVYIMGFPETLSIAQDVLEYLILLHQLPKFLFTGNAATDRLFSVISCMPLPLTIRLRLMFSVFCHLGKLHVETNLLKY